MIFANVFVKKFNNLFIQEVFFILFRVVFSIFAASNGQNDSKTDETMNALERQFAQTVDRKSVV